MPTIDRRFDSLSDTEHRMFIVQGKMPSLADYDFDRTDDDDNWLDIALERWGDRRVPA